MNQGTSISNPQNNSQNNSIDANLPNHDRYPPVRHEMNLGRECLYTQEAAALLHHVRYPNEQTFPDNQYARCANCGSLVVSPLTEAQYFTYIQQSNNVHLLPPITRALYMNNNELLHDLKISFISLLHQLKLALMRHMFHSP